MIFYACKYLGTTKVKQILLKKVQYFKKISCDVVDTRITKAVKMTNLYIIFYGIILHIYSSVFHTRVTFNKIY